jgi:preprotein translocase subunit SecG
MQALVLTIHIIACLLLITLVLLQSGKEGMGVIFGGGSSTVFGSSGAGSLLTKLTAGMAVIFILTSLAYNLFSGTRAPVDGSLMDVPFEEQAAPAPALPGIEIEEGGQPAAPGAALDAAPGGDRIMIEEQPAAPAAEQAPETSPETSQGTAPAAPAQ